jgi:hypothetical protein
LQAAAIIIGCSAGGVNVAIAGKFGSIPIELFAADTIRFGNRSVRDLAEPLELEADDKEERGAGLEELEAEKEWEGDGVTANTDLGGDSG